MRIALIGPVYPYRGGIAHYTTILFRALRQQGHKVLLISFRRQYPRWLFPGSSDKDPSQKTLKVAEAKYWIDSLNPFTWLLTFYRIRRYEPDMVILNWWTTFWAPVWFVLGLMQRLLLRRPLLIICHNVLPHECRWWDPFLTRIVLSLGTRYIVQSWQQRDELVALVPGAKATVAALPVFDMFADDQFPKKLAREQLGLPLDTPIMLFFGIVREYKGLKDVLAALPKIITCLEKLTLVVAGEFWDDKRPYLEMIDQLEIGDRVIIEDRYIPNEEVSLYFSAADVLVAPYRRATGSAVVQMARGFGVPVIATRVEGLSGLLTEGETGFLVAPGDPGALADAVCCYFSDGLRIEMSAAIKATSQSFTWTELVRVIETLAQS